MTKAWLPSPDVATGLPFLGPALLQQLAGQGLAPELQVFQASCCLGATGHSAEAVLIPPSFSHCLTLYEQVTTSEWREGRCVRGRREVLVCADPLWFLVGSWGLDFGGAGTVSTGRLGL